MHWCSSQVHPGPPGGENSRFELDNGRHVGGLNHMDLLNHPLVYEHIRIWLSVAPQDVEDAMDRIEDLPEND